MQSKWFEMFSQGCVQRMAQDVCQDWAISLPAMHGLMNILEGESNQAENVMTRVWVASLGAFAVIGFCGSF